eukprot:3150104-Pyramimonas_sp.AAC.1
MALPPGPGMGVRCYSGISASGSARASHLPPSPSRDSAPPASDCTDAQARGAGRRSGPAGP